MSKNTDRNVKRSCYRTGLVKHLFVCLMSRRLNPLCGCYNAKISIFMPDTLSITLPLFVITLRKGSDYGQPKESLLKVMVNQF